MAHPNRFQKLVSEAKKKITEISPNDASHEVGCGAAQGFFFSRPLDGDGAQSLLRASASW